MTLWEMFARDTPYPNLELMEAALAVVNDGTAFFSVHVFVSCCCWTVSLQCVVRADRPLIQRCLCDDVAIVGARARGRPQPLVVLRCVSVAASHWVPQFVRAAVQG